MVEKYDRDTWMYGLRPIRGAVILTIGYAGFNAIEPLYGTVPEQTTALAAFALLLTMTLGAFEIVMSPSIQSGIAKLSRKLPV